MLVNNNKYTLFFVLFFPFRIVAFSQRKMSSPATSPSSPLSPSASSSSFSSSSPSSSSSSSSFQPVEPASSTASNQPTSSVASNSHLQMLPSVQQQQQQQQHPQHPQHPQHLHQQQQHQHRTHLDEIAVLVNELAPQYLAPPAAPISRSAFKAVIRDAYQNTHPNRQISEGSWYKIMEKSQYKMERQGLVRRS